MSEINSIQVLIIDDHDQDVDVLSKLLQSKQMFSVHLHRRQSLLEATSFLYNYPVVDVVLLAQTLSGANEFAAFHQIHSAFPQLPIILLSETFDKNTALEIMHQGAQDYLVKGEFNATRLHRAIQYALERQQQILELEAKNRALQALSRQLETANHELEQLATIDELTQVCNRRHLNQLLKVEWGRLQRSGEPLSVLMCDVDYFKAYNDTYGHQMGDRCLQQVARSIGQTLKRPADRVARYGGEEFTVLLPNTDLTGAIHLAAEIHTGLYECNIPHVCSGVSGRVTLSIGVASEIPQRGILGDVLIAQADRRLYLAKRNGRNQTCYLDQDLPLPEEQNHPTCAPTSVRAC